MIKLSIYANLRENQNIAYCSVCTEKIHCRFSFTYIPHRLHSTKSKFHSFLSLNLPNNMKDIWNILIQNGCRFITHSPTISTLKHYYLYSIEEIAKVLICQKQLTYCLSKLELINLLENRLVLLKK